MSLPDEFKGEWYDHKYFADEEGKTFKAADGSPKHWGYRNPDGEFLGAKDIAKAWKAMFNPENLLDVGCGRGTFIAYAREYGIVAEGFDFSKWAVQNRYPRCKEEWLKLHDATESWPYADQSFDVVVALDFFEHIYEEDLGFVTSEMYRVAKNWVFLQIAIAGSGGLQGRSDIGYILKRGESIPLGLEGCAVSGHVTVQPESFWYERFEHEDWMPRRDMVNWFCALVDKQIIANWLQNSIIVLERIS